LNLNILRYVIAVNEEKNFTKAAQKLYVAQPSLSQSIGALEKQLGVQLFYREKTPIEPTAAGDIFLEWAKIMLHSEDKMLTQISAISEGGQRKLIIGASPYRSKSIFLEAIKIFYEKVKNCTIVIYEKPYRELLNILDEGKIDLIADMPQPDTIQYTSIHIADERIFVAADKKYTFNIVADGEYPSIMLSDILDKPFIIIDNAMFLGVTARSIFTKCDAIPNIVMECQSVETAHIMVTSKIGISLIPEIYIKSNNKLPDIGYYVIADMPLSREIAVVYRNDRHLSDDGYIFTQILQNQFS
jgi:DNA-binding transcriptional LysR family regulator